MDPLPQGLDLPPHLLEGVVRSPPLQRRVDVRVNALQPMIPPHDAQGTHSGQGLVLYTLYNAPQALAIFLVLWRSDRLHWSVCDQHLGLWAVLFATRVVVCLAASWALYFFRPLQGSTTEYLKRVRDSMHVAGFLLFVVGHMLLFSTSSCVQESSDLRVLCGSLLAVAYLALCFPCIVCCLLFPLVWFCLPRMLQIMQYFGVVVPQLGRRGASAEMIQTLTKTSFRTGMFSEEDSMCQICMCAYEVNDELRILNCHPSHHYHVTCIDNWFKVNATCPTCRAQVFPVDQNENIV